jgi:hypothetical protein
MRVVCLRNEDGGRSRHIAEALAEGFRRHGYQVATTYAYGAVQGDLVAAYGWRNAPVFQAYKAAGAHFLYVDLGYWNRKPSNGPRDGHHKVSLDDWCPTACMRRGCPDDRFRALNIEVRNTRPGRNVLIAGMSAKSAAHHGYAPDQWEKAAIAELQRATPRPLVYRPKPSWQGAVPLPGAGYSVGNVPLADLLAGAHMLVTHHSNAAVDAIVAGVPVYCEKGVGSLLSTASLSDVEAPRRSSDAERRALLADISYCQWTPAEMRSGICWDYMRGLLS